VSEADGFLSRWAKRKAQAQTGVGPAEPMPPPLVEVPPAEAAALRALEPVPVAEPGPTAAPLPTLDDVALLTRESDFSRFVAPGVDGGVRNAAMKKLFTDPHFNVMDGLDTYIDDYGKPDPIPESMLRMMRQSKFLGLFDDEKDEPGPLASDRTPVPVVPISDTVARAEPEDLSHEDTDLRLQQDDAVGRPGPGQGAGA
jgi:Protein of unknown function (DUF3306)